MNLEEKYPFISSWIIDGQIQIGQTEPYEPMAAVIDAGGLVWTTDEPFASLDDLLDEMDKAIGRWCNQHGLELTNRKGIIISRPED